VKPIRILLKCGIQITESFKTAYDFLHDFFYFITDLNEMIYINQPLLEISELSFKLFCAYAISLNANKFITPVPVYEMKYLLKC